jgi:Family of unknown function (DUF6173)
MQDFSTLSRKTPSLNLDHLREGIEEKFGYANVMFERLRDEIREFESGLKPDEEIGAYLASFASGQCLHIESITYRDPYYIVLAGTIDGGQKARLVQHVTQTSILFVPIKVVAEEHRKARRFGFNIAGLSGAEKYGTQKLNTVIRENSILSANSAFFFNDADAGGGLA